MKKITLLALTAVVASSAMAMDTKMDLRGRFDYLNKATTTNSAAKVTKGNYIAQTLKLKNSAKFNETMTGDLVLNLASTQDASTNGGRSLPDMVDTAAVTKSLGNGLSVIVGKQPVLVGGRENDFSGRDVYTASLYNGEISGNEIGLTAGYEVAGQNFYAQHLEKSSTTSLVDKKITGIAYYGSFMNKMIEPILSYHKVGTDVSKRYDVFTATGLRFTSGMIVAEVDYLMLKKEAATAKKLDSVVAHVRYNHEMYKPFVKYIMETGKDGFDMGNNVSSAKTERTALEVGLEMVPNKDEDMRYHVVYSTSEMKEKTGGTDKFKEDRIVAGLAFAFNILK